MHHPHWSIVGGYGLPKIGCQELPLMACTLLVDEILNTGESGETGEISPQSTKKHSNCDHMVWFGSVTLPGGGAS